MGSDLDLAIIAERPISLAQGAALADRPRRV